ncbi:MAG TPA: hypothetical protein VNH19_09040 [Candidatus Limnocylindrales bacterium]|nr:hypothetical protein [Candidatus Limnocylindrales bacterium]
MRRVWQWVPQVRKLPQAQEPGQGLASRPQVPEHAELEEPRRLARGP